EEHAVVAARIGGGVLHEAVRASRHDHGGDEWLARVARDVAANDFGGSLRLELRRQRQKHREGQRCEPSNHWVGRLRLWDYGAYATTENTVARGQDRHRWPPRPQSTSSSDTSAGHTVDLAAGFLGSNVNRTRQTSITSLTRMKLLKLSAAAILSLG